MLLIFFKFVVKNFDTLMHVNHPNVHHLKFHNRWKILIHGNLIVHDGIMLVLETEVNEVDLHHQNHIYGLLLHLEDYEVEVEVYHLALLGEIGLYHHQQEDSHQCIEEEAGPQEDHSILVHRHG